MLLNNQKLFFKANSLSNKEFNSPSVVQQITNNYLNLSPENSKKSRLTAKWEIENGKLVCRWSIY